LIAVDIGKNATLAGGIDIGNPQATVSCGGSLSMGGTVSYVPEEDRPEFPVPDVRHFRPYATGPVLRKTSDFSQPTYTNAVIAAGTDPDFTAPNVSIRGILYIEAPNKVTFGKITSLEGMIVRRGCDPDTNQIASAPRCHPDRALHSATGGRGSTPCARAGFVRWRARYRSARTSAPINGVIAASGLYFANNATTNIRHPDQLFGPAARRRAQYQATFDGPPWSFGRIRPGRMLKYDPASYAMVRWLPRRRNRTGRSCSRRSSPSCTGDPARNGRRRA
jgi:hypothetical protein